MALVDRHQQALLQVLDAWYEVLDNWYGYNQECGCSEHREYYAQLSVRVMCQAFGRNKRPVL